MGRLAILLALCAAAGCARAPTEVAASSAAVRRRYAPAHRAGRRARSCRPTPNNAVLTATGLAPVQGYWEGALVPVAADDPARPRLRLPRRSRPPAPARASTPRSREVTVAVACRRRYSPASGRSASPAPRTPCRSAARSRRRRPSGPPPASPTRPSMSRAASCPKTDLPPALHRLHLALSRRDQVEVGRGRDQLLRHARLRRPSPSGERAGDRREPDLPGSCRASGRAPGNRPDRSPAPRATAARMPSAISPLRASRSSSRERPRSFSDRGLVEASSTSASSLKTRLRGTSRSCA